MSGKIQVRKEEIKIKKAAVVGSNADWPAARIERVCFCVENMKSSHVGVKVEHLKCGRIIESRLVELKLPENSGNLAAVSKSIVMRCE